MATILPRHKKSILASKSINAYFPCNCRRKIECPLTGNCCNKAIIYKAIISTDGNNLPKCYNSLGREVIFKIHLKIIASKIKHFI